MKQSTARALLQFIYGSDKEIADEVAAMTPEQARETLRESGVTDERMEAAKEELAQLLAQVRKESQP